MPQTEMSRLLFEEPVTEHEIIAWIKVLHRAAFAGVRITDTDEIREEIEVQTKTDRCWLPLNAVPGYIVEIIQEAEDRARRIKEVQNATNRR